MKTTSFFKLALVVVPFLFGGCKSKQAVVETPKPPTVEEMQQQTFLQKVNDNAQYAKFITSKVKFSIEVGVQRLTLTGNLKMKRDDCIRLQLMAFGFVEAGRIELTPEYVLIMDRINKQYLKATYSSVDFLRNSGLNFYTLQALFWNELFLPGTNRLTDNMLDKFDSESSAGPQRKVKVKSGNLNFEWDTTAATGRIDAANVAYSTGSANASNASWKYETFSALGPKMFPANQTISFASKAVKSNSTMKVNIRMKKLTTDSNWETRSTVSDKYAKVNAEEALKKIMQF